MPLRSVTISVGPPHSIAAFSAKRWSIRVATWTPASRRSRKRKPRRSTTSFANCGCSQASRCSTIGCGWGAFAIRAAERFGAGPWNHAELRATSRGAAAHQRIGTRGARRGRVTVAISARKQSCNATAADLPAIRPKANKRVLGGHFERNIRLAVKSKPAPEQLNGTFHRLPQGNTSDKSQSRPPCEAGAVR
jgi:hypothetical protein